MKTIEKIAKSTALKCAIDNLYNGIIEDHIKEAVASGIKTAQRWIPIEEELPEKQLLVLIKSDTGCVLTARRVGNDWDYSGNLYGNKVALWKYIDLPE